MVPKIKYHIEEDQKDEIEAEVWRIPRHKKNNKEKKTKTDRSKIFFAIAQEKCHRLDKKSLKSFLDYLAVACTIGMVFIHSGNRILHPEINNNLNIKI